MQIDLEPDCSACASLCCIVFAFDESESFGIDKAAGEACPNLTKEGACGIFEDRARLGFKGCISYNCHGAGQRVTQEVFQGRSWRDDPTLVERMGAALSVLRRIHEQLVLLQSARRLPLNKPELNALGELEDKLHPAEPLTEAGLENFPVEGLIAAVGLFLRGLKHHYHLPTTDINARM